jgi:hypothetical protein
VALTILGTIIAIAAASAFGAAQAEAAGTVTVTVQGKGDVAGEGMDCDESGGPDCSQFVPNEQECNDDVPPVCFMVPQRYEVTAAPDRDGYEFQSFSGCDDTAGRTCGVFVDSSKSLTATFADTAAPSVSAPTPAGGVQRGTIQLGASASDNAGVSRVEFRVRGTMIATDTTAPYSAAFNTASVADGPATLQAQAFDAAGNQSSASSAITIDNTPPNLSITSGPNGQTFAPGSTQSWTFTASDATSSVSVACSVVADDAPPAFASCSGGSAAHSVTGLPDGLYVFNVRATDGGGLLNIQTRTFSIDGTPPESSITSGPKRKTFSGRARFRFKANETGSTFECKLDSGAFEACDSPETFNVKPGRHRLKVLATDAIGNTETTAATYRWQRKRR